MSKEVSNEIRAEVLGHIPVFRPGENVQYGNSTAVIDYVVVRKGDLLVRLKAHPEPVRSDKIRAPIVPIVWRRRLQ